MARKTYYEILGLAEGASADEIRKTFRKRAAESHPDKVMHLATELREEARVRMVLLNEAYGVLSNPDRRQEYDKFLELRRKKANAGASPSPNSGGPVTRPPGRDTVLTPEKGSGSGVARSGAGSGTGSSSSAGAGSGSGSKGSAAPAKESTAPKGGESRPAAAPKDPEKPTKGAGSPPSPPAADGKKAAAAAAGPERRLKKSGLPPRWPTAEEVVKGLEAAVQATRQAITEANPRGLWHSPPAQGFDLALAGTLGSDRFLVLVGSTDVLTKEAMATWCEKAKNQSKATGEVSLSRRFVLLLVLCLEAKDGPAIERDLRARNRTQLQALAKKRGESHWAGYLDVVSGTMTFPFLRTLPGEFQALREVGSRL